MEEMEEGGKEEGRNFYEVLNIVKKKKKGFFLMFWGKIGIEEVLVKNISNSSCLM